jgi:hypothetical protein
VETSQAKLIWQPRKARLSTIKVSPLNSATAEEADQARRRGQGKYP